MNKEALDQFVEKVSIDVAGAMGVLLAYLGDRLGLYKALAEKPMTSSELANATGCYERYVREWLSSNVAGGYVDYDPDGERFSLTQEKAHVLSAEGQPGCMSGLFQSVVSAYLDHERNLEVFESGEGIPWGDKNVCCFCGTERFFRPLYEASLIEQWLPALDGVVEKLSQGARVADVGCGHGRSTTLMASAYPASQFHGFDYHGPSIDHATNAAREANLEGNTAFAVADAQGFDNLGYDLITIFDALHDMGDPVGIARYMRSTLRPGGTLMVVEPRANDTLEANSFPPNQTMYAFSTLTCVPVSRSQPVGLALGAQAGPKRLTDVLLEAGFEHVRLAHESPGNIVLEAR